MDSGECEVAPSTPKPPARLTAATTSRQWLKASSGNSIPSISQIGDFIVLHAPWGSFLELLVIVRTAKVQTTLAYPGHRSQARDAEPISDAAGTFRSCALTAGIECYSMRQNILMECEIDVRLANRFRQNQHCARRHLRCRCGRRRFCGDVHAASAARARIFGSGLRAGR